MKMSRQDELVHIIGDIRRSIPTLTGVMVATADGLPIAHDFSEDAADRLAAMAATALGLGERVVERTQLGDFAEGVFRGRDGYLVVYPCGDQMVLVLNGPANSNLGLMRIEARSAAAKIMEAMR
jgi:predicted regulator of Ras-like GTPase activity (Roadblock/LC7/MglB family)